MSLEVLDPETAGEAQAPLVEEIEVGVCVTVVCRAVVANGRAGTIPPRPLAPTVALFIGFADGSVDCEVDSGGALGFESCITGVDFSLAIVDGPG